MYRYGGSGRYPGGRRRSNRLRNALIALAALLIGGAAFAASPPGNSVLDRVLGRNVATPVASSTATPVASPTAVLAANPPTATPTEQPTLPPATSTPQPTATAQATPSPAPAQTARPAATSTPAPKPTTPKPTVPPPPPPTPTVPPTPTPPPPLPANPLDTANAYITHWQAARYPEMHKLLSQPAAAKYNRDYFVERYSRITERATVLSVAPKLRPEAANEARRPATTLRLPMTVKMQTRQVGDITEENVLTLVKENDVWRVDWTPSLIFKDLTSDDYLIDLTRSGGGRGGIYDRNGRPLAIDGAITQVGVVPGKIQNEPTLLTRLSTTLGISKQEVKARYANAPNPEWFMPIADLTRARAAQLQASLAGLAGVDFQSRSGREYPEGAVLTQVLGFVSTVYASDLEQPQYAGYTATDVIGRSGLERWGEQYLRGRPGGELYVKTANETKVKTIKEQRAQRGADIYLNIDVELQRRADQELNSRKLRGSVVALDPNNGQILAAASAPTFDPNLFVIGISQAEFDKLQDPKFGNPFQNRATNSAYPMASTFKPITMAAALEYPLPGITTKTWVDTGTWNRDGTQRKDWKPGGHGNIQLIDALIQSCDIVFYDLGYELWRKQPDYLPRFARQWGLGAAAGVDGVDEASGLVPGPGVSTTSWNPGDNVNLGIGQGALQVTPLQAANVYATIANGGTIYRPRLINRIVAADGKVIKNYPKQTIGKAPVRAANLRRIKLGLNYVANDPLGTAFGTFGGFSIRTAGKTGTGEQDRQKPFAWYAGYAPEATPRVAIVAMAERAGEGSRIAAPIVRVLFETYLNSGVARP